MSILISLLAIIIGIVLIFVVIIKVKEKKLTEAQSLGWLFSAVVIIILGVFPKIVPIVASWLGVWYAPTILIMVMIVLITFIIFFHTTEISKLTNQINELAIQVTLLKYDNEILADKLDEEINNNRESKGELL